MRSSEDVYDKFLKVYNVTPTNRYILLYIE